MNIYITAGPKTIQIMGSLFLAVLILTALPATMFAQSGEEDLLVAGCTNPLALNVNPTAMVDDGSCKFAPEPVCIDPLALNNGADVACIYQVAEAEESSRCLDDGATNYNEEGECVFQSLAPAAIIIETPVVANTCLIPNSLGDKSGFVMSNESGEETVAQILALHGYEAIDTETDQFNYQVWDLVDSSATSFTFTMRVLGKRAGNSQIVGYYKAGDTLTFTSVLSQSLDTDGESVVTVTVPATFASSFGFALQSADKTWFSEIALNTDTKDHAAVYNPSSNTYLLAFEDFDNLGDSDYNDIVIEIKGVTCNAPQGEDGDGDGGNGNGDSDGAGDGDSDDTEVIVEDVDGGSGGGGGSTRVTRRAPTGEVLGSSTTTPATPTSPAGLVLGEATTTLPVGAPNTGAGGTAPVTVVVPTLSAILFINPKIRTIK